MLYVILHGGVYFYVKKSVFWFLRRNGSEFGISLVLVHVKYSLKLTTKGVKLRSQENAIEAAADDDTASW